MVYGGDHGEGGRSQGKQTACLSDLGFVLEIGVLLTIGILGDGWMYLEAHRPLLLICLSCFGCLPPTPFCAYDILCTSQNFHIEIQSWDVNLACNPLSLGGYSSCHIQVLEYII